jgi:hypothetical protein
VPLLSVLIIGLFMRNCTLFSIGKYMKPNYGKKASGSSPDIVHSSSGRYEHLFKNMKGFKQLFVVIKYVSI